MTKLCWSSSGFFLCFRMLGTIRVVGEVGGVAADSGGVEDEGGWVEGGGGGWRMRVVVRRRKADLKL